MGKEPTHPSPKPLRILYVITKATWGGAQRHVYDLATALNIQSDVVHVTFGDTGLLAEKLTAANIPTTQIPGLTRDVSLLREWHALRALYATIRAVRPDVLHVHSSKAGILAALAGRVCGVRRIVFTAHGWAFNEKRPQWQRFIIGILHWITVVLTHTTICVSAAVRHDARRMPFVQARFVVIPNGIAAASYVSRDTARTILAPKLQLHTPQNLWIGTIAELHPTKNINVLIDAFAALTDQTDTTLVIIGDGQERARLTADIARHNLENRVVLAGFMADAAQYLHAFDIFVLPSHSEALGYVLIEAGHASLPVVATHVGGIPEIITDGTTGILVPPDDSHALTEALRTLITQPVLRTTYGNSLHAHVTATYDAARMVAATRAQYSRLTA